nr:hypothetical protein Iba_chr01dCG0750 [Ipomoea batatas]
MDNRTQRQWKRVRNTAVAEDSIGHGSGRGAPRPWQGRALALAVTARVASATPRPRVAEVEPRLRVVEGRLPQPSMAFSGGAAWPVAESRRRRGDVWLRPQVAACGLKKAREERNIFDIGEET